MNPILDRIHATTRRMNLVWETVNPIGHRFNLVLRTVKVIRDRFHATMHGINLMCRVVEPTRVHILASNRQLRATEERMKDPAGHLHRCKAG